MTSLMTDLEKISKLTVETKSTEEIRLTSISNQVDELHKCVKAINQKSKNNYKNSTTDNDYMKNDSAN